MESLLKSLKQRNADIQNDRTLSTYAKKARIAENLRTMRQIELALSKLTDSYSTLIREK